MGAFTLPSRPRLSSRIPTFGSGPNRFGSDISDAWAQLAAYDASNMDTRAPFVDWRALYNDNPARAVSEFSRVHLRMTDPEATIYSIIGIADPSLIPTPVNTPVPEVTLSPVTPTVLPSLPVVSTPSFQPDPPATSTPSPVFIIRTPEPAPVPVYTAPDEPAPTSSAAPLVLAAVAAFLLLKG